METRTTVKISAKGVALGRVASEAAKVLMGKHKPSYVPHKDEGDFVEVSDLADTKFTGTKMDNKLFYRHTTRVGALRSDTLKVLWEKNPNEVLRKAVLGMLPKNSLRREMIKRLKVI